MHAGTAPGTIKSAGGGQGSNADLSTPSAAADLGRDDNTEERRIRKR
jgi:hypothetical protein